jgi:ATP-dependent protease ClpP protease subunit
MSTKQTNDKLFESRRFKISDDIGRSMQRDLSDRIDEWNVINHEPIVLMIDSTGGDLFVARLIMDAIMFSPAPVHGIVTGVACSAAFCILQSCHRRLAYPSARFMFHYGQIEIDVDRDLHPEETLREGLRIVDDFMSSLSKMSKVNVETIKARARASRKFGVKEALRCRFIDEVLKPPQR